MSFEPRPYQVEAIDKAVAFFQEKKIYNGIMILPTGSGKSIVVANVAKQLTGNTLVLQPSKEILEQNHRKYISYGFRAGIYSASAGVKFIDTVTFATIGSIAKKHHLFRQFKNIIIDECFPYEQYIVTESGKVKIGYLEKLYSSGKPLPRVLSYNEMADKMEYKSIVAAKNIGERELIKLQFSKNVRTQCTKNHPFFTSTGWKTADELVYGDCILCAQPDGTYAQIPNKDQKAFILGSFLGDGSIDKARTIKNMNRFRFIQGAKQKEYLEWKASLLQQPVRHIKKNGFAQTEAYGFSSKVMFFEDDHCSKEYAIDSLTARSLAVAWMDDGFLSKEQNQGSLYSTATSKELTERLCKRLRAFGIPGHVQEDKSKLSGKDHYYIKFGKVALGNLSRLIAKYVHKSMSYKLVDSVKHLAGTYRWDVKFNERGAAVFLSKEASGIKPVYNIQVADNETYVLTSKRYDKHNLTPLSGMIVHNCHLVNAEQGMYRDFIKSVEKCKVLGLTATPYRLSSNSEGAMLKFITRTRPKIFNKLLHYIQNDVLFNEGFLAKLEYYSFNLVDRNMLATNASGTDFSEASVRAYYRAIDMPTKTIGYANRILAKRKNLLIFCSLVDEALKVAKGIPGAVVLTGETEKAQREKILSDFKKGIIRCVVNVGVLTTGFDYPELEAVLIARSTMSLALYYQIIGRVMRPFTYADGTKKKGWVIDLGGNIELFGKIETMRIEQDQKGLYHISNNGRQLTNIEFKKAA